MPAVAVDDSKAFLQAAGLLNTILTAIRATKDPVRVADTVKKAIVAVETLPNASKNNVMIQMELRQKLPPYLATLLANPSYKEMMSKFAGLAALMNERISKMTTNQIVKSRFATLATLAMNELVKPVA